MSNVHRRPSATVQSAEDRIELMPTGPHNQRNSIENSYPLATPFTSANITDTTANFEAYQLSTTVDPGVLNQQIPSHHPAQAGDLRSPCPIVNSLANHDLIPHNGRSVPASRLYNAVVDLGISPLLAYMLTYGVYLPDPTTTPPAPPRFFSRLNPFSPYFLFKINPFAEFGMLSPAQLQVYNKGDDDENGAGKGELVLDLDQLGRHGGVEHDVSLSRLDTAQGDNYTAQTHLIAQILVTGAQRDEGTDHYNLLETMELAHFAGLRKLRLQQQKADNEGIHFTQRENHSAAAEIAMILKVFGDGRSVRTQRVKALFEEERLPIVEGWTAWNREEKRTGFLGTALQVFVGSVACCFGDKFGAWMARWFGVGVWDTMKLARVVEKEVAFKEEEGEEGRKMAKGKGLVAKMVCH